MRKLTSCLLLSIVYISVFSQNDGTFTIRGKQASLSNLTLTLSNALGFKQEILANDAGRFSAIVNAPRGYYTFGKFGTLYLSPGMSLVITRSGPDSLYKGLGGVENNLLRSLRKLQIETFPFEGYHLASRFNTMEPAEFIKYVAKYKAEALALLNKEVTDKFFKSSQSDNIDYSARYYIDSYKLRFGIDPLREKEYKEAMKKIAALPREQMMAEIRNVMPLREAMYTKRMSMEQRREIEALIWENFDINKGVLFTFSPTYNQLLSQRIEVIVSAEARKSPYLSQSPAARESFKMSVIKDEIKNDTIREYFLYKSAQTVLSRGEDTEKMYNEYISTARHPFYTSQIKTLYNNLKLTASGGISPEFSYVDIKKNQVSLSSLKGNYVYIDVWATWCVPCIKEIPALKTLEEKYHSKPIKFVSISVDELKDKGKWEKYVTDNNLKGIQLFADKAFKSDFIKTYGINSIPRFILIDPDGKIVYPNAIRPSNPKIEEMLNGVLSKL